MKSVMIVEPEERSSSYMTRLVQRFGYQAIAARSTAAALSAMDQGQPDAVLGSTNLEEQELERLLGALKEVSFGRVVPVIVVASDRDSWFFRSAASGEVERVLRRPLSLRDLFSCLERCLNGGRRRQMRAAMRIPVSIFRDEKKIDYETRNFSEGGMYVAAEAPLDPGSEVNLKFSLVEGAAPFTVRGRVMHASSEGREGDPPGMGLMFLHTSEAIRALFNVYVENHVVSRSPLTMGGTEAKPLMV